MLSIPFIVIGSLYITLIVFAFVYLFLTSSGKKNVPSPIKILEENYQQPFVSIIVPTYNEKKNIGDCLSSIKKLNYDNFEIIVSDGGSKDGTIEIAKDYTNLVIVNSTLPEEWIGKNWGCHLGYLKAKGEYLLFIDADTRHHPDSLKKMMKIAIERDTALLSLFPFQIVKRWWESINALFYFANHLISGGVNSVNNPHKKESYTASGQYLLFKREDYEKIGGHEFLKGSIVEDFCFARIVKTKLGRLYYIDKTKSVTTRMYPDSVKQCFNGWKKCLYPGTKLTQPHRITGALLWYLWGLLAPVVIGLAAAYSTWPFILASVLSYFTCISAIFIFWNKRGQHVWVTYVFLPLVVVMFCVLLAVSALELLFCKRTSWRGRIYQPNLQTGTDKQLDILDLEDTTKIPQLETDPEIEIDDFVLNYNHQQIKHLKNTKQLTSQEVPNYSIIEIPNLKE